MRITQIIGSLTFVAVLLVGPVFAHKFHTTFMTVDRNQKDKVFELTLKMFRHDLEPSLSKRLGRRVDLGTGKAIDIEIFRFINGSFEFLDPADTVVRPKWVGKEVEAQVIYVYLEIPYDGKVDGITISNTLFFESFKEQVNYVTIKDGDSKHDLVFKHGAPKRSITATKDQ